MRRAGRVGTPLRPLSEAVWLAATLVGAFLFLVGALFGLQTAPGAATATALRAELATWRGRAAAAERNATSAEAARRSAAAEAVSEAQRRRKAEEELANATSQLRSAQASAVSETAKRRSLEEELAKAKAQAGAASGGTADAQKLQAELAAARKHLQAANASSAASAAELSQLQRQLGDERERREAAESSNEDLRHQLSKVQEDLQQAQEQVGVTSTRSGPVVAYIHSLGHQRLLAFLAGLCGVLSVGGPSNFVRSFLVIVGSATGGLLVSSCACFFATMWILGSAERLCLLDFAESLAGGSGHLLAYFLWALTLALGIFRWWMGIECSLYAVVDDVVLADARKGDRAKQELRKPLLPNLAGHAAAERPRPPQLWEGRGRPQPPAIGATDGGAPMRDLV